MSGISNEVLELFAGLYSRLNKLNSYNDILILGQTSVVDYTELDKIVNNALFYPPLQIIKTLDTSIVKIENLQRKGLELLDQVKVYYRFEDNADLFMADEDDANLVKNEFYKQVSLELKTYHLKLTDLKETVLSNIESTDEDSLSYQLRKAKDLPTRKLALSIEQTALLFHYLRMFGVVPNERLLPNGKLAIPISLFTGYSVKNLTSDNGFGKIDLIKSDEIGDKNLATLEGLLEQILNTIRLDIQGDKS